MTEQIRNSYLAHIRRLREENEELREIVAQERLIRQRAWKWYKDRLESRLWATLDLAMGPWRKRP